MAVSVTCSKSKRPGCVEVSVFKTGDAQKLVDAIRDGSIYAEYDNFTKFLTAQITISNLETALENAGTATNPPKAELLKQAAQYFGPSFGR